jgi:hypothetical protein
LIRGWVPVRVKKTRQNKRLKRFSPGLNRGIPKRLAMMESFVH